MTDAANAPAPVRRANANAWWTLALAFVLYTFAYLDQQVLAMIVPAIKASMKFTDVQIGLVLGPAFSIAYAVSVLPFGWLADRFSRRLVIFAGVLVFGCATVACGFVNSLAGLLLARALFAVGEAGLAPASIALIGEKFPRSQMTTAISIYSAGLKVGGAAAYTLGAVAIVLAGRLVATMPQLQGIAAWRVVFLLTGAPAVLLGLLVWTLSERPVDSRRVAGGVASSAIGFLVRERSLFIPLVIGGSMMTMAGQALIGWTPSFFTRHFHWQPSQYGPWLGGIALASSALLGVKGAIQDMLYRRGIKDIHLRFYLWLLVGTLPIAIVCFLVNGIVLFFVLYAVVALVTIPCLSYINVSVQVIAPAEIRGRLAATVALPLVLAGGLGPLSVSLLTDRFYRDEAHLGYSMATLFAVCIPCAILCFWLCLAPLRRAVEAAEARDRAAVEPPRSDEAAALQLAEAPAQT